MHIALCICANIFFLQEKFPEVGISESNNQDVLHRGTKPGTPTQWTYHEVTKRRSIKRKTLVHGLLRETGKLQTNMLIINYQLITNCTSLKKEWFAKNYTP